jgi:hypothetical protein
MDETPRLPTSEQERIRAHIRFNTGKKLGEPDETPPPGKKWLYQWGDYNTPERIAVDDTDEKAG